MHYSLLTEARYRKSLSFLMLHFYIQFYDKPLGTNIVPNCFSISLPHLFTSPYSLFISLCFLFMIITPQSVYVILSQSVASLVSGIVEKQPQFYIRDDNVMVINSNFSTEVMVQ